MMLVSATQETKDAALMGAVEAGKNEIVQQLLGAGADANVQTQEIARQDFRQITKIITPLLLAAQKGYDTIAKQLLDANADVNERDEHGHSPLYYAAKKGSKELVGMLLGKANDQTKSAALAGAVQAEKNTIAENWII